MSAAPENINIRSAFSLIAIADEKQADRSFYRTLHGPKNLPETVTQIELLNMVIKASDGDDDNEVAKEAMEVLKKGLTATTSIKGNQLSMITTQRSQINVNDNRVKRGFLPNMGMQRQQEEQ